MKRNLQFIALGILVAAGIYWAAMGANRGWTKTSIPVKTLDPVTGIEGIEYQKQFLPGLDFLGAAALGAGCLACVSLFLRNSKQTSNPT